MPPHPLRPESGHIRKNPGRVLREKTPCKLKHGRLLSLKIKNGWQIVLPAEIIKNWRLGWLLGVAEIPKAYSNWLMGGKKQPILLICNRVAGNPLSGKAPVIGFTGIERSFILAGRRTSIQNGGSLCRPFPASSAGRQTIKRPAAQICKKMGLG